MTGEDITGQQRIIYLITDYIAGRLTIEETAELDSWIAEEPKNRLLFEQLTDETYRQPILSQWKPEAAENSLQNLKHKISLQKTRTLWPRIAAAASILLFLSIGGYFLLHKKPQQQLAEQIAPVNKGVVLTLGGGQQIQLTQKHQGLITAIGNTKVSQSDSLLTYNGKAANAEPAMNTLTNNSGSKFTLALADGTQVFLDVASSITYPVSFTGKERKVNVVGQVFFNVKHNATQPFLVMVGKEKIEDIGTEFNINAYANEPAIKTTLVNGAVKVTEPTASVILKPGEQVIGKDGKVTVAAVNLEEVTAWLQGKLIFHRETLESLMGKVARIYNVNVVWVDDVRNEKFGGSVSRSKKLATVLNYFRKAGNVDFQVDGNTVKVFKKKK